MDFSLFFDSNPTELVGRFTEYLRGYVHDEAKSLLHRSDKFEKFCHARLEILLGLGFESDFHFTCFIKELRLEAAARQFELSGSENRGFDPDPDEAYSLFYSYFSLTYPGQTIAKARLSLSKPECVSYVKVAAVNSVELRQPAEMHPADAFKLAGGRKETVRVLTSLADLRDWKSRSGGFALVPLSLIGVEGLLPQMWVRRS